MIEPQSIDRSAKASDTKTEFEESWKNTLIQYKSLFTDADLTALHKAFAWSVFKQAKGISK